MKINIAGLMFLIILLTIPALSALSNAVPPLDQGIAPFLQQGASRAAAAIVSGKGTADCRYWRKLRSGGASRTTITYSFAFTENQWRITEKGTAVNPNKRPNTPTTMAKIHYELAFDGKQLIFYGPDDKTADIVDPIANKGSIAVAIFESAKDDVAVIGRGLGPIFAPMPGWKDSGWLSIGKKIIGGSECILLERSGAPEQAAGALVGYSGSSQICVDPSRGYMWPEFTVYQSGPSIGKNVLIQKLTVEPKLYGEKLWGPAKSVMEHYDTAGNVTSRATTEYNPDFRLNVAIDPKDLTLQLPSGTKVHNYILNADYTIP